MKFSLNNRFITEQYVKEGLKSEVKGGIATPGQRDNLKGLKLLVDTVLILSGDERVIPAGSTVYIKEKALHEHAFFSQPLSCPAIAGKFLIVDLQFIEFIDIPDSIA